jgi:hypothetical protein
MHFSLGANFETRKEERHEGMKSKKETVQFENQPIFFDRVSAGRFKTKTPPRRGSVVIDMRLGT